MRAGRLAPYSKVYLDKPEFDGYATLYGWTEGVCAKISSLSSVVGAKGAACYADRLWIDVDSLDEEKLQEVETKLKAEKVSFRTYSSGGKGYHFEILHQRILSEDLPYSHKHWVEQRFADIADLSIYRYSGLISCVGRVHKKTGNRKACLRVHNSGQRLKLPIVKTPDPTPIALDATVTEFFGQAITTFSKDLKPGDRHTAFWSLARTGFEAGLNFDEVEAVCQIINQRLNEPKEVSELRLAIRQACS